MNPYHLRHLQCQSTSAPLQRRHLMTKQIALMLTLATLLGCEKINPPPGNGKREHGSPVSAGAEKRINNADVVPPFLSDDQVKLEASEGGSLQSPDWAKTLIIVQFNIQHASKDGKFTGMQQALDHLQELGINGVWITPINDGGEHYANFGPYTVNTNLTGQPTHEASWPVIRNFVDEAHRRNIRVFFDIVSWGTHKQAPLHAQKPEWYTGKEEYTGYCLNWKLPELCEWFTTGLVDMIMKTGADGFRCDCAPGYAGYEPYRNARLRLLEKGRKVLMISESASERKGAFDFDEHFRDGKDKFALQDFYIRHPIVDGVKTGQFLGTPSEQENGISGMHRFYSFLISCHDSKDYKVKNNPILIGYQALFAPRIPIWYLGEEWNNPHTKAPDWLWATTINWDKIEENRPFYELVKQMIRIRRQYPDIFEYFPENQRNANICAVKTGRPELLQAYARYRNGVGILIVPNNSVKTETVQITIPYLEMGLNPNATYKVSDLISAKPLMRGKPSQLVSFSATISANGLGVFLISPKGK